MIIQSSNSMSPGQPIFEFLLQLSTCYDVLAPATREHTEVDWVQFIQLINNINRAHRAVPQIREGTYYMRHTLEAAHQDVSACAAEALESILSIKNRRSLEGITDPAFTGLIGVAIPFLKSVCTDPRILSIEVPQPTPTVRSAGLPQR